MPDGVWHRLGLVVDGIEGTFTSYVDGVPVQQNTGLTLDGRWALDQVALLFADEDQENAAGFVNSVQLRPEAMSAADLAALGGPTAAGIPRPLPPTLRLVRPNGGESFAAGSTQTVAWAASEPSGAVQVDLYRDDIFFRTLGQTPMLASNFVWRIHPRIGDGTNYRVRIQSLSFPAVEDASDAPFTIFGSGPPVSPMFDQPLQTNGGFESLLAGWQTVEGQPVVLNSAQSKGAPYAGTRFLHGGLHGAGSSTVRQDIDLLAAGFTTADLDAGAPLDAEAWLRNWYSAGTFDDQVFYRVAFLDERGAELSSVRSLIAGNNAWTRRTLTGLLPPGTRHLRLEVVARHRRDADNDSMADDLVVRLQEAPFPATPQITKLPMLQDVRSNAMTLFWETDGNLATHAVEWGRDSVTEQTFSRVETLQIDATHFVQRATLTGLETGTRYVYRVRSGTNATPVFSFRTAPRRDTPFAVAWWADNHDGTSILRTHLSNALARGVDFLAAAGDMVNSGTQLLEWHNRWFKPLEHLNCAQTRPVLLTRGNHDGEHPLPYAYSALPGNEAWFAFDYGNSRFIFLDTEATTGASPEQYAWLVAELSRPETQRAAFRIACFHKPPWANLWNGGGYTGETFVRTDWVPLFERYNVDLTISGHAHNYNRGQSNGVTYTITGGGGGYLDFERVYYWPVFTVEYSLYHFCRMEVRGDTLTWQAIDNNNQIIDATTLRSRVPRVTLQNVAPTAGTLRLTVSGKPGVSYVVDASSDLSTWTPTATNTIPLTGGTTATNAVSASAAHRFFRARAP